MILKQYHFNDLTLEYLEEQRNYNVQVLRLIRLLY